MRLNEFVWICLHTAMSSGRSVKCGPMDWFTTASLMCLRYRRVRCLHLTPLTEGVFSKESASTGQFPE